MNMDDSEQAEGFPSDNAEENKIKNVAGEHLQDFQDNRHLEDTLLYDFDSEIKKLQDVVKETESFFDNVCRETKVAGSQYDDCKQTILLPVLELLNEIIKNARQPCIYLLGRSRHGKTSLINAINNNRRGKVDSVAPTTPCATVYSTKLGHHTSFWKIVDSSGFFPTTTPSANDVRDLQAKTDDCFKCIKDDLQTHKPDIILYVICCNEVGNLGQDLKLLKQVIESEVSIPPIVVALSKADIFADPRTWPPENYKSKQRELQKLLDYTVHDIFKAEYCEPLSENLFYGYEVRGCEPFFYVIPTATLEAAEEMPEMRWNVNRLTKTIGSQLPCQSWLHYYKAFQDNNNRKGISTQIIRKLSNIAMTIPNISLPGQCTPLLLLQMIMIGITARLAGHSVSVDAVHKYLVACDVLKAVPASVAAACVALLRDKVKMLSLIIGAGGGVGRNLIGVTNGGTTYCLGKSAEWYYYRQGIRMPESYTVKWKPPKQ